MARQTCAGCGADVDVATVKTTQERVALEQYTDASSDARRFRVVESAPLIVEEVPAAAPGDYFPDHDFDCPAGNDGRTF